VRAMILDHPAPVATRPLPAVDVPDPEPAAGEIRLRVRACGICRTDLHVVEGDLPPVRSPLVPGHQAVGIVDRVGSGASRFRPGERAGIAWLRSTDGTCEYCRAGAENLCPLSRYTGYHEDGGYAELAVVPEAFAYRALRRSEVPPGGRLGIFGFGSSAHVTIQVARHRGCEVFVSTRGESHRRLARDLGAVWAGEANEIPPEPLDGAILFAPAGELVLPALRSLRRGGTLAVAGIHLTPIPPMTYQEHLFHEKRLTSVEANTRADGEELLREAAEIPIRPKTRSFRLEEAGEALVTLKRDGIDGTGVLVL